MSRGGWRGALMTFAVVGLVGGVACGGSGPSGGTSPAPATSAAPTTAGSPSASPSEPASPSAPASPSEAASPLPTGSDVMPFNIGLSGTYRTSAFQPAFRFTAPKLAFPFQSDFDDPDFLPLGSGDQTLLFDRPAQVIDPSSNKAVGLPKDLAAWLRSNPRLRVLSTSHTTVGGKPGTEIDTIVKSVVAGACDQPCMPIAPLPSGSDVLGYLKGEKVRFIVVNLPDGPLLASIEAYPPDFPVFAPSAEQILHSIRFLKP
jgi:hypothetical protein